MKENTYEQTTWKGVGRRLLHKLSGQKFIGFAFGVGAIIGILFMSSRFPEIPESLYLKAIGSVVILAGLLMGVKMIQNGINKVTDYLDGRKNNEEPFEEYPDIPKDEGKF